MSSPAPTTKKPKVALRFAAFLLGFLVLFGAANFVFRPFKPAFADYHALEEDSLEVLVVGTSHMITGFNTMALWEEAGIPGFVFASSTQPFAASYLFIREALKTQQPRVVVIDLQSALMQEDFYGFITTEARMYDNFDRVPDSLEKLRVMRDLLPAGALLKYYTPLYSHHSRWNALTREDFALETTTAPYAGFDIFEYTVASPLVADAPESGTAPLGDAAQTWLDAIIALCAENGIALVGVLTPCTWRPEVTADDWQQKLNGLKDYLDGQGVAWYDYNALAEEIGLDYGADMMDADHLNHAGSLKFTAHFGAQLAQHYGVGGLRGAGDAARYAYWEQKLAGYHAALAALGL